MVTKYLVDGIHCDGCARKITKAIETAQPGSQVSVDVSGGEIEVDRAPDSSAVVRAIEGAGYKMRAPA